MGVAYSRRGWRAKMAWLSVQVKCGLNVVKPRTVVYCEWADTFGDLPQKLGMEADQMIEKVLICADGKFILPQIVPINAPISIADQFKCSYVCIFVEPEQMETSTTSTVSGPLRSASEVLMQSSRQVELPSPLVPPAGKELRSDHKLYNDLLSKSLQCHLPAQCEVALYFCRPAGGNGHWLEPL